MTISGSNPVRGEGRDGERAGCDASSEICCDDVQRISFLLVQPSDDRVNFIKHVLPRKRGRWRRRCKRQTQLWHDDLPAAVEWVTIVLPLVEPVGGDRGVAEVHEAQCDIGHIHERDKQIVTRSTDLKERALGPECWAMVSFLKEDVVVSSGGTVFGIGADGILESHVSYWNAQHSQLAARCAGTAPSAKRALEIR